MNIPDEKQKEKNDGARANVLVTGSGGFVGTSLCRELLERGFGVVAIERRPRQLSSSDLIHAEQKEKETHRMSLACVGDIGPDTDWISALVGVDLVVHLAARVHVMQDTAVDSLVEYRKVNVEGTKRLAEAAALAGVKRFVYLSTIKVNGEMTGDGRGAFTESDTPKPEDPYGVSKWEAELALRDIEHRTGMAVVIIRPPLIYGPGVKANFLKLIQFVDRGIPLPLGGIKNLRSLLGLTNLVGLICCCLIHPSAVGETFLASDGEDVSTPELVHRIATALGKSLRLISVPQWVMNFMGMVTGKSEQMNRLCGSLQVDSSKVSRVLGWTTPCSMREELEKMVNCQRAGDIQYTGSGGS